MADVVESTADGSRGLPVLAPVVVAYEERLTKDKGWALDEGHRYFQEQSAAHNALRRITKRLNDIGVDYAVVGGMALFHHGFRRFTEDVDILVTRAGLNEIHAKLDGLGYVRPFAMSKNLRDAELGVKIEFLVAGDYPGDGKPKPVSFPDPALVYEDFEGMKFVNLPAFLELKLASGMTNPLRGKDLVDVQELVQTLDLPREFAKKLNPFVQPKFEEIWQLLHASPRRYLRMLRPDVDAVLLEAMVADGVQREPDSDQSPYICLATTDPQLAARHGMVDETEYWDES